MKVASAHHFYSLVYHENVHSTAKQISACIGMNLRLVCTTDLVRLCKEDEDPGIHRKKCQPERKVTCSLLQ